MRRTAIAVAAVLALAACGRGSDSTAGAGGAKGLRGAEPVDAGAGGQSVRAANGPAAVGDSVALGRSVIRTATMTVKVRDVSVARRDAVLAAERAGGYLEAEHSTLDTGTTLTLRVEPESFTGTVDAVGRLGEVLARQISTEDVTGDVADVDGRLRAARTSADRVRGLLGKATSISEVTTLESELSDRESDIESLSSRQRALSERTALATVTATLQLPPHVAAPAKEARGFTGGLAAGWRAFTATTVVVLVATGALLPFLALAGAGVTVWLVVRRRRRVGVPV